MGSRPDYEAEAGSMAFQELEVKGYRSFQEERIPDLSKRLKGLPAEDVEPWTAGINGGSAHE
jgi:hypothetical protein